MLLEAKGHLEESIQARLELGDTPEEAERQAVAAFGRAERIGDEVRSHESRIDRRFLLAFLSVIVFWAVMGVGRSFPDWMLIPMLALLAGVHIAFALTSAWVRRIQWRTFAILLLPCLLLRAIPDAKTYVTVEAPWGATRTLRATLAETARDNRKRWRKELDQIAGLQSAYGRFVAGKIDLSPSRIPSYHPDGTPKLYFRESRAAAASLWRVSLGNANRVQQTEGEASRWSENLENAIGRLWIAEIPFSLIEVFKAEGWGPLLAYGSIHVWGLAFGAVWRRFRARRQPPQAIV
jgi:hypothetical protein